MTDRSRTDFVRARLFIPDYGYGVAQHLAATAEQKTPPVAGDINGGTEGGSDIGARNFPGANREYTPVT